MKKAFTFLLLLSSQFSFAQNLVPNWSFEEYDSCPNTYSGIIYSVGWSSFSETPDYFNSCSSLMGVPSNDVGFQFAKTGNAYAGLITYARFASNYREIIGIKLKDTLSRGKKYFVSFYVSRAFSSSNQSGSIHINAASNKIGARLSTIAYFDSGLVSRDPAPIDNRAQVFSDSVITDTLNWFKISGSFVADSPYHYISIGNFFTDSATTHILLDSNVAYTYYYIDDVILSTDSLYNGINNFSYPLLLIKIFPNPARDWIAIEGSDLKSFSIFDISGRRCIEDAFAATSLKSIYVGNLSKGIYFIHVNTSNQSFVQKLIIE